MKRIGIYDAKTNLSSLIHDVEESGEILAITKHGKVVAELHPPSKPELKRGCMKSPDFQISADFDEDSIGFEDFWGDDATGLMVAEDSVS
jgi:antitoxin (DNA-binding transcriptional repressor) of toxin-antitoxin stability system